MTEEQRSPESRNGEAAETPYKIDAEMVPMEAFAGNPEGTKGEWYAIPSWRVHFDHDGLRGFDIRLHRSVDSQAVWTLSEATTGCRITGDIPHEFYIGDETAMLAEFCAGMMKRITRESMVAQIEKALARQAGLPPRPSARSETGRTIPDWMIIDSVRYCIGRMTYQVGVTCEWLRSHWASIPEPVQKIVIRDIREEFDRDTKARESGSPYRPLGHDCDRFEWSKVLDLAANHDTKEPK